MSNVIPFDTLAMALALRDEAGFDPKQAEGAARVLSRFLVADLVTKTDLTTETGKLEANIRETRLILESKCEAVRADIVRWLFGSMLAQTGLMIAALKMFH